MFESWRNRSRTTPHKKEKGEKKEDLPVSYIYIMPSHTHTDTREHTHIHIYIYICQYFGNSWIVLILRWIIPVQIIYFRLILNYKTFGKAEKYTFLSVYVAMVYYTAF